MEGGAARRVNDHACGWKDYETSSVHFRPGYGASSPVGTAKEESEGVTSIETPRHFHESRVCDVTESGHDCCAGHG
jgi:hypothetical protein